MTLAKAKEEAKAVQLGWVECYHPDNNGSVIYGR